MKKRILAFLLAFVMAFSVFPVWAEEAAEADPYANLTEEEREYLNDLMYKYYQSVMKLIINAYNNGEITEAELYGAFIKELIGTDPDMVEAGIRAATTLLDSNSYYLNQEEYEQYYQHLAADYCGIGVIVTSMNGPITVTGYSAEKTPAKTAGMLPGDVIVSVDGVDVSGMTATETGTLIKGEKGTSVRIGILRNGERLDIDVIRNDIEQNPVSYKVESDYMYIKLTVFSEGSSKKVGEALKIADARGIKKIILDLRDNGGGLGTEAFALASLFIPKDEIITTIKYNDSELDEVHKSTATFRKKKYTTAVLVNENSASCSEMVAGALQDHGLGYLIGKNTYGKSTGQQFYPIDALGGYLKLTISRYCTPSGNSIPDDGITPDKYVVNKKVSLNKSGKFKKMTFERKPVLGDSGEDISACKERFNLLGYYVGDTDNPEFDKLLEEVVKKFQSDSGLYSYGVLDNATMYKLYEVTNGFEVEEDTQMEAAIEYLGRK